MRPAGKTACLFLLLLIFTFPLYAADPDEGPLTDGLLFFEELFFEEFFSSDGSFMSEELLPDDEDDLLGEEAPADGEDLLSEETLPGEEGLLGEEAPAVEEGLLTEESPSGEEGILSEETPPGEEPLRAEGDIEPEAELALANEGPPSGDEDFLDDGDFDAFFFEAPPLIFEVPTFELRSLDEIFPTFSRSEKVMAMSSQGIRNSFVKEEAPTLIPNPDLEIDLLGSVMKKNPSHLIEALVVVPYNEKELDLLDIYNALGRIGNIKDHPASISGQDLYIFTESSRIVSARNRKAIPDPAPAVTLPFAETMYLCLKEINFGNLFIRGDISISMYGITYSMTNFADVRYYLIPMMKAERFVTTIYLEPVKEGVLIYSMTGFYLPGFIADKVNLTPNINRRIRIFISWITAGLREQETIVSSDQ